MKYSTACPLRQLVKTEGASSESPEQSPSYIIFTMPNIWALLPTIKDIPYAA